MCSVYLANLWITFTSNNRKYQIKLYEAWIDTDYQFSTEWGHLGNIFYVSYIPKTYVVALEERKR